MEGRRGCPFSFSASQRTAVFWNGRSPVEKQGCPFSGGGGGSEEPGPGGPNKRATRRRRVNLDSLGESLRRLTSPTVQNKMDYFLSPPGLLVSYLIIGCVGYMSKVAR